MLFNSKQKDIDLIINLFPKQREKLPLAYEVIYKEYYKKNRAGETQATSISAKMERWLHKQVSKDLKNINKKNPVTLEIGAGNLNHLKYEENIEVYDIVEPFSELFKGSAHCSRIRNIFEDISEIKSFKYDRIISVATFEHIINLPYVVATSALLLEKEGTLRVSIPNEGTILWKLGTMVTGFEFKKLYGLDYQVLMRYEHVNNADEIEAILKYFFGSVETTFLGIHKKIAFYRFFACKNPNLVNVYTYFKKFAQL